VAGYRFRFLLLFVLFGSVSAWSQERVLSEEEFDRITVAANSASYVAPYRITMRSEHFERSRGNQSIMSVTETSEAQSEDRRRILRITIEAGITRKVENITVSSDSFERIDDGPWKRLEKNGGSANRFTVVGDIPLRKTEFTFRYLGKDLVNSISADLYESRKFREYEGSSFHRAYTVVTRFWVHSNGKFLKKDSETFEADGSLSFRMSTYYEYPAKIRIEPPIK